MQSLPELWWCPCWNRHPPSEKQSLWVLVTRRGGPHLSWLTGKGWGHLRPSFFIPLSRKGHWGRPGVFFPVGRLFLSTVLNGLYGKEARGQIIKQS